MMNWLKEYNLAGIEPFIEALNKTRQQCYEDKIDILIKAGSIPGVSLRCVLNKLSKKSPAKTFVPK